MKYSFSLFVLSQLSNSSAPVWAERYHVTARNGSRAADDRDLKKNKNKGMFSPKKPKSNGKNKTKSPAPSVTPSTSPSVSSSPSDMPSDTPSLSAVPSMTPSTSPSVSQEPSVSQMPSVSLAPSSCADNTQVWDLADDFVAPGGTPNPNGVWTYGKYAAGSFVAFDVDAINLYGGTPSTGSGSDLYGWHTNGSNDPNILKNFGSLVDYGGNLGGLFFPSGAVVFGPFEGPTVARFTAPCNGVYHVEALFRGSQTIAHDPGALGQIYSGAASCPGAQCILNSSNLAPNSPAESFFNANVQELSAGDVIDFVVDGTTGTDAGAAPKSTLVDATINLVTPP